MIVNPLFFMPKTRNEFLDNLVVNLVDPLKVGSLIRGVFSTMVNSKLNNNFFETLPRQIDNVNVCLTIFDDLKI